MKNKQVIQNIRDTDRKKVDFMIHERVAFDFYSDDFQKYVNAWDPKVVSTQQHCFLEHGKYIKGDLGGQKVSNPSYVKYYKGMV